MSIRYSRDFTIYDGNLNGDVLRNKIIVHVKQREGENFQSQWINHQHPRSVNNVNVDIFTCLA